MKAFETWGKFSKNLECYLDSKSFLPCLLSLESCVAHWLRFFWTTTAVTHEIGPIYKISNDLESKRHKMLNLVSSQRWKEYGARETRGRTVLNVTSKKRRIAINTVHVTAEIFLTKSLLYIACFHPLTAPLALFCPPQFGMNRSGWVNNTHIIWKSIVICMTCLCA
jgi:hypothetical protein